MLRVEELRAGYDGGTVLRGITLAVSVGGVHAIVGHNGAGKTTLLHAIAGLVRPSAGRIRLDDRDLTGLPVHRIARAGVALVPQGRRVFASLTVAEHLALSRPRRTRSTPTWTVRRVLDLVPALGRRLAHRGAQLSGGEQQMLAIARALLLQPRLLLLDEPTEGLGPAVVQQIRDVIATLAAEDVAVLLATPHPELAIGGAGYISVLETGRVVATLDRDTARAAAAALIAVLSPTPPARAATGSTATTQFRPAETADVPSAPDEQGEPHARRHR